MKLVGIFVNIIVPGIGSIIIGRWLQGITQLVLILSSITLFFMSFGFVGPLIVPTIVVTWFWALLTAATYEEPKISANHP